MATPRISRMGVSRRGGPRRTNREYTPPALFSMATRPIRQPPATETDLPCVPRLISFPSTSAFLFPPPPSPSHCDRSLCLLCSVASSAPFSTSRFLFFFWFHLHTRVLHVRDIHGKREGSGALSDFPPRCFPPASFSLALFDRANVCTYFFFFPIQDENVNAWRNGSHVDFADD